MATTLDKSNAFRIEKMPDGGFVVLDSYNSQRDSMDGRFFCGPLFASTKIGDALEYIRDRLEAK